MGKRDVRKEELQNNLLLVEGKNDQHVIWSLLEHYNPVSGGTIIRQEKKPVVGIWLMPDNTIPGMLEDFVGFLRPQDDLLWPMVDEAVLKVKLLEEEHRFRDVHESKARIHTWLAWQKEPGKPMGQAITARYLDANASHAQQFIAWIRKLFDLESL